MERTTYTVSRGHRSWVVYSFTDTPTHIGTARLVAAGYRTRKDAESHARELAGTGGRVVTYPQQVWAAKQ